MGTSAYDFPDLDLGYRGKSNQGRFTHGKVTQIIITHTVTQVKIILGKVS